MLRPQPYRWKTITLDESVMLRAFAILAIVLHNYLHWIADAPGENEFTYEPERTQALIDGLLNAPLDCIRLLITYFGHYGVQVFFFLSGYGIAVKYRNRKPSWLTFQKARWSALYPSIVIAALGYIFYESLRLGWNQVIQREMLELVRQMIGISSFFPDNIYYPIGPWWFIGVILQFYLLAPLILQWTRRFGDNALYALAAGSFLFELLVGPILSKQFDFNINHSILGHLDVCAMGIWFARREEFPLPKAVIAGAAGLFILGNFYAWLWITTGATSLLVMLPLLRTLSHKCQRQIWIHRCLMFIGQLSMYIFLCNGYLRRPLIEWAQQTSHWWTSIWTSLVFLAIVLVWAILLRKCEQAIWSNTAND
ncbi:MAG: acyltransferase [Pseudomonadota bacterium]|nr:acyltransferase [Pseudomonadota bacterium]